MKIRLLALALICSLFSATLSAQNTCSWTEDPEVTEKENLLSLLECLADGESHWLLKKHFQSVKMVMEKPDAEYDEEMLEYTASALEFFKGDGQYLSTYINTDVRPLIMAYTSPTDDAVSYYLLTLPDNWKEDSTTYPMYCELHGSGGGKNNNPLRISLRSVGTTPAGGMAPQYRRDGFHLYPWGRGDKSYEGIAESDVWECLEDFDAMIETDQNRQYMYGFSMGGGGTWKLAHKTIERWAAIGCYSPAATITQEVADVYANTPVWTTWGSEETWAKTNGTGIRDMISEAGGTVRWHEVYLVAHKYLGEYQWDMLYFFDDHAKDWVSQNSPPVFTSAMPDTTVYTDSEMSFQYHAFDPDEDTLSFYIRDFIFKTSIDSTGLFSWQIGNLKETTIALIIGIYDGAIVSYDTAMVIVRNLTVVEDQTETDQERSCLFQNYPNPFYNDTEIKYFLPARALVELSIYDANGRLTGVLENQEKDAGYHQVKWEAAQHPPGIYYCRLSSGDVADIKKFVLLR